MKRFVLIFSCLLITFNIQLSVLCAQNTQTTYYAPFSETKVFPKLKKETVKQGTLAWTPNENLRMDYSNPEGDYTLIEPGSFIVCHGGKVQKLPVSPSSKTGLLRQVLLYAFQGNVNAIAELTQTKVSCDESGARKVCTLTADEVKQGYKSLVLEYDKKDGNLYLLTMTEANGNYTTWSVK